MYFFAISFMSCSYLPHTIFRILVVITFSMTVIRHRVAMGDEIDTSSTSVFAFVNVIILELGCYNTFKAMAKLFIESKSNEKRQIQLEQLLNTVPDNVLICSKNKEGQAPIGIYGNERIN